MGRDDVKVAQEISAFLGKVCGATAVDIRVPSDPETDDVQWEIGVRHRDALKELKLLWDVHCAKTWPPPEKV